MTRRAFAVLTASLSLIMAFTATSVVFAQESPSIVVRGTGEILRDPDVGWIRITALGRDGTSSDAARKSAQVMAVVQAALAKQGIADADMRTLSFTLQPEYDRYNTPQQRMIGFIARNQLEAKLVDLTKVSAVVDAIGQINNAGIDSVRFDVRDREAVEKEAMTKAVADAMASARAMARGAGQTAGRILKMQQEGVSFSNPFTLQWNAGGMTVTETVSSAPAPPEWGTPIIPGPVTISARVVLAVSLQ
jgi:uncharacterized protein YggE